MNNLQLVNDLQSGVFLQNMLMHTGLDLASVTSKAAMRMRQKADEVFGEDAQYVNIEAVEGDDPESAQVIISFDDGYEFLEDKYPEAIEEIWGEFDNADI